MIDKDLQRYYEDRFALFGQQGWKDLIDDVSAMLTTTNDVSSIQDEKSLHFKRGELSIMRWILSIEESSREAHRQLEEDER